MPQDDFYDLRLTLDEMIDDLKSWETSLPFYRRAFANLVKIPGVFDQDIENAEKQMRLTMQQWQLVNRKFRQATARDVKRLGSYMAEMEEALAQLEEDFHLLVPGD